jgi:hypothetical protein
MAEGSSSSSSGDLGNRPMKRARGDGGSEARPQPLLTISGVDSPRTCGPGIASLWREGLVTDCIVVVEGREFAAHRVVLAAASPFMKAAFASGMQESISARVTLRDMRAAVFEAVITFMYENATSVPEADIAEVLQAARLLQEQELTNATLNLLIARLSPASCIETWRMGDVLSLPSLAHRAKLFAFRIFRKCRRRIALRRCRRRGCMSCCGATSWRWQASKLSTTPCNSGTGCSSPAPSR